jgi:hypothetical protein
MAGITYFVALPFDVADGSVVVGEPIECLHAGIGSIWQNRPTRCWRKN